MKMLPFQTAVYDTQNHYISALRGAQQLLTFSLEKCSRLLVIDEENADANIRRRFQS